MAAAAVAVVWVAVVSAVVWVAVVSVAAWVAEDTAMVADDTAMAAGGTVATAGGGTMDGSLTTGGGEATGIHHGGAAAGREDIAFVPTRPA